MSESEEIIIEVPEMPVSLREEIAAAARTLELIEYLEENGFEDAAEQLALDFSTDCPCDCGYRANEHDEGRYEATMYEIIAMGLEG